jgi:Tol biopolymer transport system component
MAIRRGRLRALVALALAFGLGCRDETPSLVSEGLVFVRRHGPEAKAPRDLAWARLADGHVEVIETPDTEEMWPYYSSKARLVAFLRGRKGLRRGRLWLWDPATGEQRPATNGGRAWESWPDWSPTHTLVAYDAVWRGRGGIEVLDVASGRRVQVATTTSPTDHYLRPSFGPRPDLLVAQRVQGTQSDLFLLREGSAPKPLLTDPAFGDEKPSFARDGRSVLFTRAPVDGGARFIAEIDVATRALRILAPFSGAEQHTVSASPARDEVAFVRESAGSSDLWLMTLPDGEPRNLTKTPDWNEYAVYWSPDGERVALTGSRAGNRESHVRVVDRSGTLLFEAPGYSPDWMPPPR